MANNIDQYKAKESNVGSFTATPVNSENEQRQNILYDYYKGGGIFNDANYQNWRNEKAKTPTNYIAPNKSKPDKPKNNNIFNFSDFIKDSPSANDVDNAAMKSHQYYRTQVEKMLGHPVNALSDEQVKKIYIDKTGDESPYLNTGSNNPYYTPTMAAIDNSAAATVGDLPFSSQEESERTRDGSAYWDANRDERHNVNPVQGYYAELYANRELPKVSDQNDNYWAQSPENMILDTSVPNREETRPTAERNYGNYYDGRSGNTMYTRYDEPVGPAAPVATQNYGYYYDGLTGNGPSAGYQKMLEEMVRQRDIGAAANSAQWATNRDRNIRPSTLYQDAANNGLSPDQRNEMMYHQLIRQGMTKDEILQWAQSDAMDYMSPEEAMRFYFYADNQ